VVCDSPLPKHFLNTLSYVSIWVLLSPSTRLEWWDMVREIVGHMPDESSFCHCKQVDDWFFRALESVLMDQVQGCNS